MNVLSLFDGISCGYLALQRAKIPIKNYYAYETDKYALKVSQTRFPQIQHFGDVRDADFSCHKNIHLLIGGSPCQDLSIAKRNRKGLNGEKSCLFWEYVRALKEVRPKYFLFENVSSMSKNYKNIITKALVVEPILINSALVSAQNRKRLYWTNIPNITQPKDKELKLEDILENGNAFTKKSYCLTTNIGGAYLNNTLKKHMNTMIAVPVDNKENRICDHLELHKDKKPNALTAITKDYMVCKPLKIGTLGKKNSIGSSVYSVKGKSICLLANGGGLGSKTGLYKIDLPDGDYYVRKLTPLECERLQTLPDNFTNVGISNTQRYKCLGNAWTVDVIAHIFSFIE